MEKIGLGCVTFGREIDAQKAFSIMDYAIEKEIFFWDTAAVYGHGASEKIIGEWLSANADVAPLVALATKILPPYSEGSIDEAVARSLQRLSPGAIDIMYLHNWDQSATKNNSLQKINDLINSGVVKSFGLSNFNYEQIKTVLNCCDQFQLKKPAYIQNNHNFSVSDLNQNIIDLCNKNNIKIVSYSPLGAGYLTGKHNAGVVAGSRFDMVPAHQKIYFTGEAASRMSVLLNAAREFEVPPAKLALAWAFDQPFVSKVLIGAREKKHIDQCIEAIRSIRELKVIVTKMEQACKGILPN